MKNYLNNQKKKKNENNLNVSQFQKFQNNYQLNLRIAKWETNNLEKKKKILNKKNQ